MHLGPIGYEQQYQIKDAAGNVLWMGTAIIGKAFLIVNTGAAAIPAGTATIIDGPNSVFGRWSNLVTNDPDVAFIAGKATVDANSVGFLGVAIEPIAVGITPPLNSAQVQKYGRIAGSGSLTTVICTSAAIAVGTLIVSSGAGTCAAAATKAATVPAYGTTLGICMKANAQIGTSGIYNAGVQVAPE